MGTLWFSALVLVVLGFTVQALDVRGTRRPLEFLVRRKVHPRRWGMHVLAAGSMLSLGLWCLTAHPWSNLTLLHRIALGLGGLWAALSLALALFPLVASPGPSESVLPSSLRPRSHGAFLLLGSGISIGLVWVYFAG